MRVGQRCFSLPGAKGLTSVPSRQGLASIGLLNDVLEEQLDTLPHRHLGELSGALVGDGPAAPEVLEHGSERSSSSISVTEGE